MKKAKLITLAAAIFCSVTGAYATTVYTYTGSPFTDRTGSSGDVFHQMTISLTFAQPLGSGVSADTPLDWAMSDGFFTLDPSVNASLSSFQLYVDQSGNILGWLIAAFLVGNDGSLIADLSTSPGMDQATLQDSLGQISTAWVIGSGTWTEHTLVPEPGYSALVLIALAGGFAWRRRSARQ